MGVEKTVIERVEFDQDAELLVAHVRPTSRARSRCGICGRRSPGYDAGAGRRRWRALDLGTIRAVLEADAVRVTCAEHGVVVAGVPWARHDAGHTYAFDQTVAWLATQSCQGHGDPADADRVAHRWVDHLPGVGRRRRRL